MSNGRGNNHFEKTETYEITTDFNEYTIVVHSDLLKNKSKVYLYVGDPVLVSLFGLYEVENEPVRVESAGPNTYIDGLVKRMIEDYEICFHQHEILANMDGFLEIDHVEALRKRRERFTKLRQKEKEPVNEIPTQDFSEIPIYDWNAPKEHVEQEVVRIADENNMSRNSVAQLKQYRDKIS